MNRLLVLLFLCMAVMAACTNNNDKQAGNEQEVADSAAGRNVELARCYENFFKPLPKFTDSAGAFLQLQDGRKVSLTAFFREEFMSPVSQYGRKDLDSDGKAELVIYNNTGGAHCCDEFYIFNNAGGARFRFAAHLLGGGACIDAVTNIFTFSLNETLGYFFGCYACAFRTDSPDFNMMREIRLRYAGGALHVVPYESGLEKQNISNLEVLNKHGFEKVEGLMDNGWRKEFAMNFAVWHYNHGKNWSATRKLFNKYYTFEDAEKVWDEFHLTLTDASTENTF